MYRPIAFLFIFLLAPCQASLAQWSILKGENDSVNYLVLREGDGQQLTADNCKESQWPLPYPIYQFQTGDVDGNGSVDALVGVIKPTRFYPTPARRLFVFKNHHGHIRPLWMGSKLGGILEDFRWTDGGVRALERTTDGRYYVSEYTWNGFGFSFTKFFIENVPKEEALPFFNPSHND